MGEGSTPSAAPPPPPPPASGGAWGVGWRWVALWAALALAAALTLGLLLFFLLPLALGGSEGPVGLTSDSWPPTFPPSSTPLPNPLLLPSSLAPRLYDLRLQTFLDYDRMYNNSFLGDLDVTLECLADTDFVRLHALNLSFDARHVSLRRQVAEGDPPDRFYWSPISVQFNNFTQMATLQFPMYLQKGHNYTLSIARFVGKIRIDAKGLYLSSYHTVAGQLRFLTATQFEVAEARKVFPCWDEPRWKARFRVTIVRRESMRSIANMPRVKSKLVMAVEARGDGFVEDHYQTSVLMSTYLVAFVVSDFESKAAVAEDGTKVRAFARPQLINDVDHALDMTLKTLKYFSDYFDIPYALRKLDLIALPDFSHGAMENWGLITFKEKTMLYNPAVHPRGQKEHVSMIVGHEVAHQWFGNLVTMEWWNDLWLNEGFSHYMGYVATAAVDPDEPMEHVFILANVMEALKMDSMLSTHPVLNEVFHPDEIVTLFDTITYKKGSCLIRMMVHFLGEDVMRKGLQIYLKRHQFGNTVSADLWRALNEAVGLKSREYRRERMGGLSVATVMDNWVRQTGYPLLTLTRRYDGSRSASLQQRRFVLNAHQAKDNQTAYEETWYLPFTYQSESESRAGAEARMTWLHEESAELTELPPDDQWLIGNVDLNGFYRVTYDERNWELILRQLQREHTVFSVAQRAQILDSAFELASAEEVPIQLAMNATAYLARETEYLPWSVGLSALQYVDTLLAEEPDYPALVRYAQALVRDLYFRLGWEERAGEHKHTSYLRNILMDQACYYRIPDCLRRSRDLFFGWMRSGSVDGVPLTLRSVVQCQGVREGGQAEWDFVWGLYGNATGNTERMGYLKGLACTRDPVLVDRLLEAALNGSLVNGSVDGVPLTLRSVVQCQGVREGGQAEWDFVWGLYGNATGNTERMGYLKGLACTRDPVLVDRLLEAALNGSLVKAWHVAELVRSLSRFQSGRQPAWDFIRRNWDQLYSRLKELTGDLGFTLQYFSRAERLEEVSAFLEDKAGPETKKFDHYKEKIQFNVHWRRSHAQDVLQWLRHWHHRGSVN